MPGPRRPLGLTSRKERRIRATLIALAVCCAVALAQPAPAFAGRGCNTRSCEERVARKQCSQTRVVPCIRRAALRHRQPFRDLLRVARCESGLDPYAVGFEVHHGLFQFLPSTFASTPYAGRSIMSAKWNALAAAWAWKVGRRGEWACQ